MAGALQAIGPVSGAHYNPVVSMAALINGRIEWQACLFYVLSQLLGSIAGAFIAWCLGGSGLTLPAAMRHSETKALVMEILITSLLVLVFLGATDPERGDALKDLAGIAVGLALAVGHWVGIPFSGGSMNPFRTLASAITESHWDNIWIYFVGPPVGSALSAVLYRFVFSGAKDGGGGF
ncbi:aquaporin-like [Thrips palmi]|uniref:Aquaporin-like n=1 Tax=Thrips palmi TaxID=161013 RepID=A0A6P8Z3W7_THRPL|nr:aquaporin-like [Thrips palmi]